MFVKQLRGYKGLPLQIYKGASSFLESPPSSFSILILFSLVVMIFFNRCKCALMELITRSSFASARRDAGDTNDSGDSGKSGETGESDESDESGEFLKTSIRKYFTW